MNITGKNIGKLKDLLLKVPAEFSAVPLKIFNAKDGKTYASIEVITPNASISFSAITLLDKIADLSEDLLIKIPVNKIILNQIFGGSFDNVNINKFRIEAETDKKKISLALMIVDENSTIELPFTNDDLYKSIIERNPNLKGEYVTFNPNTEDFKEFMECYSTLRTTDKDNFEIKLKSIKDRGFEFSCADTIESSFTFIFDYAVNCDLRAKFDKNLAEIINKLVKFKDKDINMLISEPIIAFTVMSVEEGWVCTFGIPSKG